MNEALSTGRHPYARIEYARALLDGGAASVLDVPEWRCAVIRRPIPGGGADAAGPYPRTPLLGGVDLALGLERLRLDGLVSVVLVTDPFAGDPADVERNFDCRPFKTHFIVDRNKGPFEPSQHHRERIKRGNRRCEIEAAHLRDDLPSWRILYRDLVQKRGITGVSNFSDAYFNMLSELPELVAFTARAGPDVVGMTLWFEWRGVAYSHLTAVNARGYASGATYALNDAAIAYFSQAKLVDLGGAAGNTDDLNDGLAQFKAGFANSRATAMLCTRVLDQTRYHQLASGKTTSFFPAYRG